MEVEGTGSFCVAIKVVDDFERLCRFETLAAAEAYSRGWDDGAGEFSGDGYALLMTKRGVEYVNDPKLQAVIRKMESLGLKVLE